MNRSIKIISEDLVVASVSSDGLQQYGRDVTGCPVSSFVTDGSFDEVVNSLNGRTQSFILDVGNTRVFARAAKLSYHGEPVIVSYSETIPHIDLKILEKIKAILESSPVLRRALIWSVERLYSKIEPQQFPVHRQ